MPALFVLTVLTNQGTNLKNLKTNVLSELSSRRR